MTESSQLSRWRGEVGAAYLRRNPPRPELEERLAVGWGLLLSHMSPPPRSILEVGAANGHHLRGLGRVTSAELWAVEPNDEARSVLAEEVLDADHALDGTLSGLPLDDAAVDLVFTSGVLIHLPDDELEQAYRELHRVSRRWLVSLEYFAPTKQSVSWHGEEDILFKRDYGAPWLDLFDDVDHVANGWFWNRTTGLGDVTWWIFRKRDSPRD